MEIMKIGGILLLAALALWIIKSLFDWWGEPLMVEETCEPGGPPMTADTAPAADVQPKVNHG
jgi:hypothetical protein